MTPGDSSNPAVQDSSNPEALVAFLQNLLIQPEEIDAATLEKTAALTTNRDLAVRFWARKVCNQFKRDLVAKNGDETPVITGEASETVELLHKKLSSVHKSTFLAISVIEQILKRREPQSLQFLSEYLDHCGDTFQLSFLTKNLCVYFPSEDVLHRVIPFLKHSDDRVVANTIEGIEKIRSDNGIPIFTQMLRHDNHRVRANSLKALARYDGEKTFCALSAMLKMREKPHFVIAACYAARELKNPGFLPALEDNLGYRLLFDDSLSAIRAMESEESKAIISRRRADFRYFEKKLAEALGEIRVEEAARHPWYNAIRVTKALFAIIAVIWIFLHLFFPSPERVARGKLAEMAIKADTKSVTEAIRNNELRQVELLLAAGVAPDSIDEAGNSFFHLCAMHGNQDIFATLQLALSKPAQNAPSDQLEKIIEAKKNRQGENIFQVALRHGQIKFLQYLAATGFNLSGKDDQGNSLLHSAVANNQEEILVFLLMQQQNVNARNNLGNTPLHDAVSAKSTKMVYWLIQLGKADPTVANNNGFSPDNLGLSNLYSEKGP